MSVTARACLDGSRLNRGALLGGILVLLLTVFAVAPLTYPGFFQVHSGFLPAFRVQHLSDAPKWDWAADPVRGEGQFPYLLTWPFFRLSGSGIVAVKWGYGLAFLLAALATYAWTRPWLGTQGAVLASVVYTYLPWHLSAVYVRGAFAEAWLWALWPLIWWALGRQAAARRIGATAVLLLAVEAAGSAQQGLALLMVLVLFFYLLVFPSRPRRLLWGVLAAAVLVAALTYVVRGAPPAPHEFTRGLLYPYQLLMANGEFQLGLAGVGLSIAALALWKTKGSGGADGAEGIPPVFAAPDLSARLFHRALLFWAVVLLVVVLLTLRPSAVFWRVTGLQALLTHPWQLLAVAGLPLAFLAGSVARLDGRLGAMPVWAGLVALVLLTGYPLLSPRFTQLDPGSEPVAMLQPADASAPSIVLLDYEVVPPSGITPTLTLTLTWQAVEPVSEDYTVFVHLLSPSDVRVAQIDVRPCAGECPTNTWRPGEILTERHSLSMPPDAPLGPYHLAVGLYRLETGERVAVVGRQGGTVLLDVP